jgi:hypothetical protein
MNWIIWTVFTGAVRHLAAILTRRNGLRLLETFPGFLEDLRLNALSALSGNANKAKPPIW